MIALILLILLSSSEATKAHAGVPVNYSAVEADIAKTLTSSKSFWPADFGNYGPLFIRQAWHCAGSYRKSDGRGGCDGGRQRFDPERSWPDNTNLDKAKRLLWPVKEKHPSLSWGDLIILAGDTAIKSMGGPILGFCGGRVDDEDGTDSLQLGPTEIQAEQFPCPVQGDCPYPLGANTVGLIYVNPAGPFGNPYPNISALQIREVFGRMGMNDTETVALISGGHSFGKAHGACPSGAGPSPQEQPSNPWPGLCGNGKGSNTFTSGFEGSWTDKPTVWGNDYFNNLLDFKWVLTTSPAGKPQWKPSNPTNAVEAKYLMLTSDIALLHDPLESYQKIVQVFAHDLNLFNSVFAHAWYKLVTRDMGPISRCVGPLIPPAQSFQNPLPPAPAPSALPSWPTVRTAVRVAMKTASAAIEPDLVNGQPYYGAMFVHLAYACAATFRRTDYLGGCNGARIRFSPQKDWSVNAGLQSVLEVLAPIKQQFDAGLTWADLIVFAAQVAIEDASGLSLLFCAGRSDAIDGDGSAFLTAPVSLNYSATITQIEQQLLLSGLSWNDTVALQARPRSPTLMAKMGFKGTYTADPSVLNNQYFDTLLLGWASGNWTEVHTPQREFQLQPQAVYATPSDLDVINDQNLQPIAMALASDNQLFLQSFAAAWTKLVSLDRFDGPSGNLCPAYVAPLPVCLFGDCTTNPTGCVSGTTCIRQSAYFSQCQDSATANGKNCVALLQYGCAAQACCNAAASCQKGICILPTNCK